MTTFTPPTEFPHECIDLTKSKVILYAKSDDTFYIAEITDGNGTRLNYIKSENLRDIPEVTSTWQNVYPSGFGLHDGTRETADRHATENRIAVLRRDTVDGVATCTLEDV